MKQEIYTDLEIKEFAAIGKDSRPQHDYMTDWIFHFNPYTQLWNAIPRNVITSYWSDSQHKDVLRSKHLNTLLDIIHRFKGDAGMIDDVIKGEIK